MRTKWRRFRAALCAVVLLGSVPQRTVAEAVSSAEAQPPYPVDAELRLGQSLEGRIEAGQSWMLRLTMDREAYISLNVTGLDVRAVIRQEPAGAKLGANSEEGALRLCWWAVSGSYLIALNALEEGAAGGYTMEIREETWTAQEKTPVSFDKYVPEQTEVVNAETTEESTEEAI